MTARAQRHPRLPRGPFSRPIDVKKVKDDALAMAIEASAAECAAVAAETDLPGVALLSATFSITRRSGGRFEVSGRVRAEITQICVVTLEPFESRIDQPVDVAFAPVLDPDLDLKDRTGARFKDDAFGRGAPVTIPGNDDQVDPPDPLIDDTIDLGALAVEFLTLSRDPYPRKPGVQFDDAVVGDAGEPAPSAFAALERLKDRS